MISYGPIIFGLIFGLVLGTQIKTNAIKDTKFTMSSYVIIIIAAIVMAWQLGEFPFYDYLPVSSAFVSAFVGIMLSKFIFARSN